MLNSRAQALQDQIDKYASQIADKNQGGEGMADRKRALDLKQTDLSVAMQRYLLASIAFENARVDLWTHRRLIWLLSSNRCFRRGRPIRNVGGTGF